MEEWLDLGEGHSYKYISEIVVNNGSRITGILIMFSDGCREMIFFRGYSLDDRVVWDVISENPLTLSPEIHATCVHDHHGYIREGRWESA